MTLPFIPVAAQPLVNPVVAATVGPARTFKSPATNTRNMSPFTTFAGTAINSFLSTLQQTVADPNWYPTPGPWLENIKKQTARGFLQDHNPNTLSAQGGGAPTLFFQYNPEEVTMDQGANYIITSLPGRSHPYVQWVGGNMRKISFTLRFWFTNTSWSGVGNVADCINWIQSYLLPDRDQSNQLAIAPRTLDLYLGNTLAAVGYNTVHVLLLSAPVRYMKLWEPTALTPRAAEMNLEFMGLLQDNQVNEYWFDRQTTFGAAEQSSIANPFAAGANGGIPGPQPVNTGGLTV